MTPIDDDYKTCVETYATLCVTSTSLGADFLSSIFSFPPTRIIEKGKLRTKSDQVKDPYYHQNGCFYSSKQHVSSRDCRRHLNYIIDAFLSEPNNLSLLRRDDCEIWVSILYDYTQGGPTLSPEQMSAFAKAKIELVWDLYHECRQP